MKKKSLSSKEKEFCRLYLCLADPGAAAEGAGYEGDFLKIGNALFVKERGV